MSTVNSISPKNQEYINPLKTTTTPHKSGTVEGAPSLTPISSIPTSSEAVSVSTLASRLSAAAAVTDESNKNLNYNQLHGKVLNNQISILYPLDSEHKTYYAKEAPDPNDASSAQSAQAATDYISGKGPSPFAGMSRDQLSTIQNDESGTFTVNEKRAAYRQAYIEEEAWRSQVLARGSQEYSETGKLTNFFKENLAHFSTLPKLEQALYPENYAADLTEKIKLDFNFFTHSANDAPPTSDSLANALGDGKLSNGSHEIFDLRDYLNFADMGPNPTSNK